MNFDPTALADDWQSSSEGGRAASKQLGRAATPAILLFIGAKIIEELVGIKNAIERLNESVRTQGGRR